VAKAELAFPAATAEVSAGPSTRQVFIPLTVRANVSQYLLRYARYKISLKFNGAAIIYYF